MGKQTSNNNDISLGMSQVVAFLTNMLDLTKTKRIELEQIGDNIYKELLQDGKNQIMAIANTAGSSTANDFFIDALNAYDDELYDEFPDVDILIDKIRDCIKLFRIAHGKSAQGDKALFDNAAIKALSNASFQRKPQFPQIITYDPYMRKKQNTDKIVNYKGDE